MSFFLLHGLGVIYCEWLDPSSLLKSERRSPSSLLMSLAVIASFEVCRSTGATVFLTTPYHISDQAVRNEDVSTSTHHSLSPKIVITLANPRLVRPNILSSIPSVRSSSPRRARPDIDVRNEHSTPQTKTTMSQAFETLTPEAQKTFIDAELDKGISDVKHDIPLPLNTADAMTCVVLGLSVKTMVRFCDDGTRDDILRLASATPALLAYEPGEQRARALQVAWSCSERRRTGQDGCVNGRTGSSSVDLPPTSDQRHASCFDAESDPPGRPYVAAPYVSIDVIPLIDHWPAFVREAFAAGEWRFAAVGEGGAGSGGGVGVEIREFGLDVVEWFMGMEGERGRFLGVLELGAGEEGQEVWVSEGPGGWEARTMGGGGGGVEGLGGGLGVRRVGW